MGRVKGSRNKNTDSRPLTSHLSSKERITLLANLIIEKIIDDQKNGKKIFSKLHI